MAWFDVRKHKAAAHLHKLKSKTHSSHNKLYLHTEYFQVYETGNGKSTTPKAFIRNLL